MLYDAKHNATHRLMVEGSQPENRPSPRQTGVLRRIQGHKIMKNACLLIFAAALVPFGGCASGTSGGGGGAPYYPPQGFDAGSSSSGGSAASTSGSSGGTTCSTSCTPNATECTAQGLIRTCVQGSDGCWRLSDPSACPTYKTCAGGTCVKACTDECTPGSGSCANGKFVPCVVGVDGCAHPSVAQSCPAGEVCAFSACGPCSSHDQCGSSEVCVKGACSAGSGLEYTFTFVSAEVPQKEPDSGVSWDGFGGLPDPKLSLYVDDQLICHTSTVQDSTEPFWLESCSTVLKATSTILFYVYDVDAFSDDLMDSAKVSNPIAWVKKGGNSGPMHPSSAISLTWKLAPKN